MELSPEQSTLFDSFDVELTADGSPTLRLKEALFEKRPESMHHSGGAASETRYIYTLPFNIIKKFSDDIRVGVVGLGLGYIELSLLKDLDTTEDLEKIIEITSFEKVDELTEKFKNWIFKKENNDLYNLIQEKIIQFSLKPNSDFKIQDFLEKNKNIQWNFLKELSLDTQIDRKFNFIAYDAFSRSTDHPLWSDEFLDYFLSQLCDQDCVFTTYACTGSLKRALVRNGFYFMKRLGFSQKRDSTIALRGVFISQMRNEFDQLSAFPKRLI